MRKSKAFQRLSLSRSWKAWLALAFLVTVIGIVAQASSRKMPSLIASFRMFVTQETEFDPYDVRNDHASNDNRSHVETGL